MSFPDIIELVYDIHHTYVNKKTGEGWTKTEEELAEHCEALYDILSLASKTHPANIRLDKQQYIDKVKSNIDAILGVNQ